MGNLSSLCCEAETVSQCYLTLAQCYKDWRTHRQLHDHASVHNTLGNWLYWAIESEFSDLTAEYDICMPSHLKERSATLCEWPCWLDVICWRRPTLIPELMEHFLLKGHSETFLPLNHTSDALAVCLGSLWYWKVNGYSSLSLCVLSKRFSSTMFLYMIKQHSSIPADHVPTMCFTKGMKIDMWYFFNRHSACNSAQTAQFSSHQST